MYKTVLIFRFDAACKEAVQDSFTVVPDVITFYRSKSTCCSLACIATVMSAGIRIFNTLLYRKLDATRLPYAIIAATAPTRIAAQQFQKKIIVKNIGSSILYAEEICVDKNDNYLIRIKKVG